MAMVDPTDATKLGTLAVELRNALIKKGIDAQAGGNGPASVPPPPPTMGMKPEDAYARGKKEATAAAQAEAVKAYAESVEGLSEDQRAMVRECTSIDHAKRLVKTYPRAANQNDPARLGMPTNPKTEPKGAQSPFARMRKGPSDPMVREAIGLPSTAPNEHGISTAPAHVLTFSFAETARNYQDKYRAKMREKRAVMQ